MIGLSNWTNKMKRASDTSASRSWPRKRKYRLLGAFLAVLMAVWLALLGQWIMHLAAAGRISPDIAYVTSLFWRGVIVYPAWRLSIVFGWPWSEFQTLTAAQLRGVLCLNTLLWGVVGGLLGQLACYFGTESR
jgi:hypothetical protein